jgi:hypothetical protein
MTTMNKLIVFILLALFAHTPTINPHSLSIGIHLHLHAHRASSATLSWLGNRISLPVAILIDTGENLINQHNLCSPLSAPSKTPSSNPGKIPPSNPSSEPSKTTLSNPGEWQSSLSVIPSNPSAFSLSNTSCNPSKIPSSNPESTVAMPSCSTSSTIFTMPTQLQDAENRRKEEEAMAAATLQQEKEAAARHRKGDTAKTTAVKPTHQQPAVCQVANTPSITPQPEAPPASVVSPPSATNLNSLLSGHVGQEVLGMDANNSTITTDSNSAKEKSAPPTKKKAKKLKEKTTSTNLSSSKRNRSGSVLKQGRFATAAAPTAAPQASAKVFNHEHVYYEAGLKLKGDDKYATYVKQIGLLFENIQLVDPTAIMHASIKSETAKPLGSKSKMSNSMTIFLGYAPVGGNSNVFKPRKNSNKKKGRHGKDKPDMINPSIYPTLIFSSDVDPDTITSRVTHEFCRAGGFYFRKKELQCTETCTPFIIYYLYTFNDLATICYELSSLIGQAYEGMQNNFILLEEFEHHQLPKINIR